MHREYHKWWSPSLGRDMEMLVVGHAGARVLVFPTSKGKFFEWEDRGMYGPEGMGHAIQQGLLQVYAVDSVDAESWYNYGAHPGHRGWRQTQYMNYVADEVMPLSRSKNKNPFLITVGASFGAYHAADFAFRFPHQVGRVIGMSGIYDIKRFTAGYSDDNVYFNNPMDFVQHECDGGRLDALRKMDIILVTGSDDSLRSDSERMSSALWSKGIGNALRLWNGWSHDWPYWKQMLNMYASGHD
jgi:esterase/lipase superfamily enzyme